MRKLAFIFLFFTFIHSNAQNRVENIEVGPVFEALITELDDCIKDKQRECVEKADKVSDIGELVTVAFLNKRYVMEPYYLWIRKGHGLVILYRHLAVDILHSV